MSDFELFVTLVGLLAFVAYARGALADLSLGRLDRYCGSRRADRSTAIVARRSETSAALAAWSWMLLVVIFIVVWHGHDDPNQSLTWRWVDRLLLVWLAFVGLQFWWGRQTRKRHVEGFLFWCWPILDLLRRLAIPVLWLGLNLERLLYSMRADDSTVEKRTRGAAADPRPSLVRPESELDMMHRVLELPNLTVSEIMTPRTDMVMLKLSSTLDEARQAIANCGHSRIPVYGDTRDDIRGIVYAKDLLPYLSASKEMLVDLAGVRLREALYVPEDKLVDVLLREFQHGKVHIALVLDEYGGVAGLVTIEDILEQIVGEIVDEHDRHQTRRIRRVADNVFEIDARLHVDELNEAIPLELPENADYDTVGGFVFSVLGRIPKPGESFRHENALVTIVDASDRVIKRVRIALETKGEQVEPSRP